MSFKKTFKGIMPGTYKFLQTKKQELEYFMRKHTNPKYYPKVLENKYLKFTGKKMDFYHPVTYSQKIQWLKINDPNPLRSTLANKIAVRDWIKDKIGEEYLVPVLGIYESFDEIDFSALPNRFVIKTNHSSGWNVVVKDKNMFDVVAARKKINKWLSLDYAFWTEFEPHYSNANQGLK